MSISVSQSLDIDVVAVASETYAERIEETLAVRMARVEALQDAIDTLEDEGVWVPAYLIEDLQDATEDLEMYAGYWGFDC